MKLIYRPKKYRYSQIVLNLLNKIIFHVCLKLYIRLHPNAIRGGGAVGKSVSPACGRLGVQNPAPTDLPKSLKQTVTDPLSRVLTDYHYKRMFRVEAGLTS